ncbi:MAG TPA: hypothetical protein VIJ33_01180, partial [Solirubrobacteraceae bacterium]
MYAVNPIPVNSSSVAADRAFIGSAPHDASTAAHRQHARHDAQRDRCRLEGACFPSSAPAHASDVDVLVELEGPATFDG